MYYVCTYILNCRNAAKVEPPPPEIQPETMTESSASRKRSSDSRQSPLKQSRKKGSSKAPSPSPGPIPEETEKSAHKYVCVHDYSLFKLNQDLKFCSKQACCTHPMYTYVSLLFHREKEEKKPSQPTKWVLAYNMHCVACSACVFTDWLAIGGLCQLKDRER